MQLSHLGDATAPAVTTKTRLRGVWAALLQASKLKGFSRPGLCLVCREETAQCHSRQCLNHHKLRARVQFIWPQYVASAWDAKVSSCPWSPYCFCPGCARGLVLSLCVLLPEATVPLFPWSAGLGSYWFLPIADPPSCAASLSQGSRPPGCFVLRHCISIFLDHSYQPHRWLRFNEFWWTELNCKW